MRRSLGDSIFLVVLLTCIGVCLIWNALAGRFWPPREKITVEDGWDREIMAMGERMQAHYNGKRPRRGLWWWVAVVGIVAGFALIGSLVVVWR